MYTKENTLTIFSPCILAIFYDCFFVTNKSTKRYSKNKKMDTKLDTVCIKMVEKIRVRPLILS